MKYKFSKEVIDEYADDKPYEQLRLYKLLNENDQIIGQFFYYSNRQYFVFGKTKILVEVISKIFKKTVYNLIDYNTNQKVGEYEIFGGRGIDRFWQDVPSIPTATIHIEDKKFNFRRISADINFSTFKKETWGYFKFKLYATKGNEFYDYTLKMDIPVFSKANYHKYRPFVGQIESNSNNILIILAGMYLMDIEFEYEDNKNDE